MLSIISDRIQAIEADPTIRSRDAALRSLADVLGLDDFGDLLMRMPNGDYPKLSNMLPAMASDEVQDGWTGAHGIPLLKQTIAFVRSLAYNYACLTGSGLNGTTVLDFGCGWGRIARLMWYFTAPPNVIGLDPWDASIATCRTAGLGDTFIQSDYLPARLPVGDRRFDVAYAFSVFTHLSMAAAQVAFAAIRAVMRDGGVLLVTIRPVEYWEVRSRQHGTFDPAPQISQHTREGFAFFPLPRAVGQTSEITYGDTSMSLEWIADNVAGWRCVTIDRSLEDEYQIYVYLRAV